MNKIVKLYIFVSFLKAYDTSLEIEISQEICNQHIGLLTYYLLWQEYTEEQYKKDLHDPDNHDGVITDLEPDILECEVKWALESITMNKASRGDGIPVELFQILKDDAVKVLHSICQQIWKTQQFSFQSQRNAMPKNAQTTAQLHSSHTLVK